MEHRCLPVFRQRFPLTQQKFRAGAVRYDASALPQALKGQLYGSTFTEKLSRSANIQTEKSCEEKKRLQDRSYDRRKRNRYARYGSAASRDDVDRSPMRRTGANKKFACRLENTTIEKSILNTIHPKEL